MNTAVAPATKTKRNVKTATVKASAKFDRTVGGLLSGRQPNIINVLLDQPTFQKWNLKTQKRVIATFISALATKH